MHGGWGKCGTGVGRAAEVGASCERSNIYHSPILFAARRIDIIGGYVDPFENAMRSALLFIIPRSAHNGFATACTCNVATTSVAQRRARILDARLTHVLSVCCSSVVVISIARRDC